jgi:hypothetical protein
MPTPQTALWANQPPLDLVDLSNKENASNAGVSI